MTISAVSGQNAGNTVAAQGTVSVAFPNNVQTGSLIVIFGWRYRGSNTAYTAGNCTKLSGTATIDTISLDRQHTIDFGGGFGFGQVGIWSALVTSGGSLTMQIGGGDGGTYQSIAVHEFTGNFDANRLEDSNSNATATDNVTPAHSNNATSAGHALFVGALSLGSYGSQTITPDSAYTQIYEHEDGATSQVGSAIFRIVASGTTSRAEWTVPTIGNEGWLAAVAVYREAAGGSSQFLRPSSDISTGAWQPNPSSPATLYDKIDEATADDADYIFTESNSTASIGLSAGSTPDAGTQTLRIRARGSPAKRLVTRLMEGANARATINVDPLTSSVTLYTATASGITDYSSLRLEFEAADATSPPGQTVSWGAAGTGASGTTSCAPSYPTGISAATSKIFCFVSGRSNTASTVPTMPAGWTHVVGFEGGTGTWGVDTGTRRCDLFVKDTVDGTESGTVTVSLSGTTANTLRATIFRVEVPSGYSLDIATGTGEDTTNDTSFSITSGTALSFQPGDMLLAGVGQNVDSATGTSALSATGITFGAVTRRVNVAVTNGNDHRSILAEAVVSSGSGTVAPTHSYTASAACSGAGIFVRLRAVPPTEFARVTWAEFEIPLSGGGGGGLPPGLRSDSQTEDIDLGYAAHDWQPPDGERLVALLSSSGGASGQTANLGGGEEQERAGAMSVIAGAVALAIGGAAERELPGGAAVASVAFLALGNAREAERAGAVSLAAGAVSLGVGGAAEQETAGGTSAEPGVVSLAIGNASEKEAAGGASLSSSVALSIGASLEREAAGGASVSAGAVSAVIGGAKENEHAGGLSATAGLALGLGGSSEVEAAGGVAAQAGVVTIAPGGYAEIELPGGLSASQGTIIIPGGLAEIERAGGLVAAAGAVSIMLGGVAEHERAGGSTLAGITELRIGGAEERERAGAVQVAAGQAQILLGGAAEREAAGGLYVSAGGAGVLVIGGGIEHEAGGGVMNLVAADAAARRYSVGASKRVVSVPQSSRVYAVPQSIRG